MIKRESANDYLKPTAWTAYPKKKSMELKKLFWGESGGGEGGESGGGGHLDRTCECAAASVLGMHY